MPVRNRKQKDLKVSTFALLLVVGVALPTKNTSWLMVCFCLLCVWGGGEKWGGGVKGPGAVFSDCVVCFFCCL